MIFFFTYLFIQLFIHFIHLFTFIYLSIHLILFNFYLFIYFYLLLLLLYILWKPSFHKNCYTQQKDGVFISTRN